MIKVNIHEARTHLSRYLSDLKEGREDVVVVCHRNVPVAELRAVAPKRTTPRPIGLARGAFAVPESFFEG